MLQVNILTSWPNFCLGRGAPSCSKLANRAFALVSRQNKRLGLG